MLLAERLLISLQEMRAKRSAEKLVESRFEAEVQQQRSKLKQVCTLYLLIVVVIVADRRD